MSSHVTHDLADPLPPPIDRRRRGRARGPIDAPLLATHLMLLVLAAISLVPFAWLVCASVKTNADLFRYLFLPHGPADAASTAAIEQAKHHLPGTRLTFDHYAALVATKPFVRWLLNSFFVSCANTVIVVTLSSLGGFALAKYRFAGRRALMLVMLATMTVPGQVLLPSSYELMRGLGWLNSYLAILVPAATSVFGMFLFMQAMRGVPDELLQCGRLDGCSELRLWWEVALPIVRPMVGAFTLLTFMGSWNSFLWPQIVLQDPAKYTLPVGLASLTGLPADDTPYGLLMAATLLSVLPVIALFVALQRDFVAGLASGAVKG
jgi:ABC-type glycerol-3-phosphate transport system permease component